MAWGIFFSILLKKFSLSHGMALSPEILETNLPVYLRPVEEIFAFALIFQPPPLPVGVIYF